MYYANHHTSISFKTDLLQKAFSEEAILDAQNRSQNAPKSLGKTFEVGLQAV
jgi:hypothetical protein